MLKLAVLTLVLAACLGVSGCTDKPTAPMEEEPPPNGGGSDTLVSFSLEVAPLFSEYRCTGCHGDPGNSGYSVLGYAAVFGPGNEARALGLLNVRAGKPDSSYLVWKLEAAPAWPIRGLRMPRGAGPMDSPDIALIRTWIRQGASNN
jgi:hypothetical protein